MYRNVAKNSKISLRSALIIPFVLQIFLAVGLTGYFSLQSGQRAVNDIAFQLRHEMATRIEQNLQTYLAAPHLVNQINATAISLGQLNMEDMTAWEHHIWQQKKQFNSLNGITIINEKGKAVSVMSDDAAGRLVIRATKPTEENRLYTYLTNSQGERLSLIKVIKNHDIRKITAYQESIKAGKHSWTKIYFGEIIKTPIVTAGLPIYDKKSRAIGVSLTTLRLSLIGDFLRTLKVGKTGQIFIIERDGMLVATSTAEKPYRERQRFLATESQNILTQATAKYLTKRFNHLDAIKSHQPLEFLLDGQKQLVEVFPFQDSRGIDWLIVIAVPENDFMEQINANRYTTILLCLLALSLATALGIQTSRWIARPIWLLGEATSAIAGGEFEQKNITSSIKEVSALSTSFNSMSQQLKQSYEQLEDYSHSLEQKVAERTQKLEQEIRERKQIEQQLRTSLKEKEVLLREVYHRVKNNMQLVSSLLNLQADTIADSTVLRLLSESQQRVKTMALIHERLYRSENLARINAATYIRDLVNNLVSSYRTTGSSIQVNLDAADLELDLDMAVPCSLIINELVSNALKYAFPDKQGEIKLQFWLDNTGNYYLIVKDDGIGIPTHIDPQNVETLGMQLVYGLTEQLGGAIELDRQEGSQFRITFRKRH